MKLFITAFFIATSFSFAATTAMSKADAAKEQYFDLRLNLSLKGKHIPAGGFQLPANSWAEMWVSDTPDSEKTYVRAMANEQILQNKKGILMQFEVGTIAVDGTKTVISKPQIFSQENNPATMTTGKVGGPEEMALTVTAKKISR